MNRKDLENWEAPIDCEPEPVLTDEEKALQKVIDRELDKFG